MKWSITFESGSMVFIRNLLSKRKIVNSFLEKVLKCNEFVIIHFLWELFLYTRTMQNSLISESVYGFLKSLE